MPVTATEVMVTLQRPPLVHMSPSETNYFRFRLSPEMIIAIGARVKRPGDQMLSEPAELRVVHHETAEELDPDERLLGDPRFLHQKSCSSVHRRKAPRRADDL
jgi:glucose-6-phosphate 1-dehydrogenase